jgi:hypothetical protein
MITNQKLQVYRNLHKNCFSVMSKGLVIAHVNKIILSDVHFIVRQAGYNKFKETNRKNVHAFVKGYISNYIPTNLIEISYNPKLNNYFFIKDSGEEIKKANFTILQNNKIYIGE